MFVAVDLVEAARSWGGQLFVLSRTELSHYLWKEWLFSNGNRICRTLQQ